MAKITKASLEQVAQDILADDLHAEVLSPSAMSTYIAGRFEAYTSFGLSDQQREQHVLSGLDNCLLSTQVGSTTAQDDFYNIHPTFIGGIPTSSGMLTGISGLFEDDDPNGTDASGGYMMGSGDIELGEVEVIGKKKKRRDDSTNTGGTGGGGVVSPFQPSEDEGEDDKKKQEEGNSATNKPKTSYSELDSRYDDFFVPNFPRELRLQIEDVLSRAPFVRELLGLGIDKYHTSFNIDSLDDEKIAQTNISHQKHTFEIVINSKKIHNGIFFYASSGTNNNVGFEHRGDVASTLAAVLAHEAIHVSHFRAFFEAMDASNNDPDRAYRFLQDRKYSEQFLFIFFDGGQSHRYTRDVPTAISLEHAYINVYEQSFLDSIINTCVRR